MSIMLHANRLKLLIFFIIFSPSSFGIVGSITDPGFFSEKQSQRSESFLGPIKGSFRLQLSRNFVRSEDKFLSLSQKEGLFGTFSAKSDLNLSYSLAEGFPSLKNSRFFSEIDLFAVLSYIRPVYAGFNTIRKYCFKSHFCFGDMALGVSNSLSLKLKEDYLKGQYSFYLNLPYLSKSSLDQKQILGIGSSLRTNYPLFSKTEFQLSAISYHFLDIDAYGSKWGDNQRTFYNELLSFFNQLGLRFHYSKNSFIPTVLVYGSHRFSLNYNGVPFHILSLGFSSVWSVGRALQIIVGLDWADEVFKPEGDASALKTILFNPDGTFINGGVRYSF